jgi:hypothetical protein
MSILLWVIAALLALDALVVIGYTGKVLRYTPSIAVMTAISRAFMVTVLVIAAVGGVTP